MKKLGLGALSCYAIHAGFHILNRRPEEVLWMGHLCAGQVLTAATLNLRDWRLRVRVKSCSFRR